MDVSEIVNGLQKGSLQIVDENAMLLIKHEWMKQGRMMNSKALYHYLEVCEVFGITGKNDTEKRKNLDYYIRAQNGYCKLKRSPSLQGHFTAKSVEAEIKRVNQ